MQQGSVYGPSILSGSRSFLQSDWSTRSAGNLNLPFPFFAWWGYLAMNLPCRVRRFLVLIRFKPLRNFAGKIEPCHRAEQPNHQLIVPVYDFP